MKRVAVLRGKKADPVGQLHETPEEATQALLRHFPLTHRVWEPCCGPGAIVRVLRSAGHLVVASDVVDYGDRHCEDAARGVDFLRCSKAPAYCTTIVTNFPYSAADQMVRHALTLVPQVIGLFRLAYLEGSGRSDLIDGHLRQVLLGRERLAMMHRDGWTGKKAGSQVPFGWFVFDRLEKLPGDAISVRRISWRPERKRADEQPALEFPRAVLAPAGQA